MLPDDVEAGDADDDGRGDAGAADRLLQRREPAAGARVASRQREISIRAALGAGRWRIVRQLLTESMLIGLLSAPLGIGIAWIGIKLLDSAMPADEVPYFITWSLNARSLAYTVVISMLTGIVFGLAPALQAVRSNLQSSLKEGGRGSAGGSRACLRNTLVIVEVALSLVLLVGASLFVRSFLNLQTATVGFDTAPLMSMRFYLPGAAYEADDAKARRVDDIVRRDRSAARRAGRLRVELGADGRRWRWRPGRSSKAAPSNAARSRGSR